MQKTEAKQPDITNYAIGFGLSVALTIFPFVAVTQHMFHGIALYTLILVFAVLQLIVQLKFFIHLGHEQGIRWNAVVFGFTFIILLIVVLGSIWIMQNLNYNMMPGHDAEKHIMQDEGMHNH